MLLCHYCCCYVVIIIAVAVVAVVAAAVAAPAARPDDHSAIVARLLSDGCSGVIYFLSTCSYENLTSHNKHHLQYK